ncbi:hypothetical protein E2C01_099622 [Portunus trituberculatus]|uniref:Uncharacterized protein n=1 Tax=Portunus trituberculatus TaxID=210409 RepID=A0A5B7KA44_PORTR|nr:hypothetical protein [Portunus trituberculatus]
MKHEKKKKKNKKKEEKEDEEKEEEEEEEKRVNQESIGMNHSIRITPSPFPSSLTTVPLPSRPPRPLPKPPSRQVVVVGSPWGHACAQGNGSARNAGSVSR